MPRKIKGYGWIPDLPDHRDLKFAAPAQVTAALPPSVDLTSACPPVYNQENLGSCTANAIAAALEFDQMKQNESPIFVPSRLFIYYNERVIENDVTCDNGAQIRDGMKSVVNQGACPEDMWPYNVANWEMLPPAACYQSCSAAQGDPVSKRCPGHQSNKRLPGCWLSNRPWLYGLSELRK